MYNPPLELFRACVESVRAQTFQGWELILVDDCSTDPAIREEINRFVATDSRIISCFREENGGIIAATNNGFELANNEFIALLDHDDDIVPDTLMYFAQAITECPDADYLYSDEVICAPDGQELWPLTKPAWSPERMRTQMYTCHMSVIRTKLAREVGGFREGYEGAQDYDLILRITEKARRIVHIPRILYHWNQAPASVTAGTGEKSWAYESGIRAVQEHCARVGIDAVVEPTAISGVHHIARRITGAPLVSIIIPTGGSVGPAWGSERTFAVECIRSIVEKTTYANFEIVVVVDAETSPSAVEAMVAAGEGRVEVMPFSGEFNFSTKCNLGSIRAAGDYLLFLNDDTEVITPTWIEELLGPLQDQDAAMTGAKLLFPDRTIQHAGQCFHEGPMHIHYRSPDTEFGHCSALHATRECSGVTAACALVKREIFEQVGGFAEALPSNYNDVDLCMKIRFLGHRIVWTPHAVLWHFESASRDPKLTDHEKNFIRTRWGWLIDSDPYYTSAIADRWAMLGMKDPDVHDKWRESDLHEVRCLRDAIIETQTRSEATL